MMTITSLQRGKDRKWVLVNQIKVDITLFLETQNDLKTGN